MKTLATLPKPVLLMEAAGALLLITAGLLLHGWIALPAGISPKVSATAAAVLGIVLMLPAAWLMIWRTAKALAPQLLASTSTNKRREPHDTDH